MEFVFDNNVLIVAKCIVNVFVTFVTFEFLRVLIVAKCIVNVQFVHLLYTEDFVLIVAKCIVNIFTQSGVKSHSVSINSSKVYCK